MAYRIIRTDSASSTFAWLLSVKGRRIAPNPKADTSQASFPNLRYCTSPPFSPIAAVLTLYRYELPKYGCMSFREYSKLIRPNPWIKIGEAVGLFFLTSSLLWMLSDIAL
jgi:hypothetical protein